jgi:putative protein-disulfide isomerase
MQDVKFTINHLVTGILTLILCLGSPACQVQTKKNMTEKNQNPLLCDPETGVCEMPADNATGPAGQILPSEKPVRIIYFTDPICSSCWGIEPQLRKLKLEYGDYIDIDYRMGGLLPDWSYNSGGISKPSDVAHHWEEVSAYYEMPIEGGVWLKDPLPSSYPPSIAVKAAQLQGRDKAVRYMRQLREMVFLDEKNIARMDVMLEAAAATGLDVAQFKTDYEGRAKELFQEDLAMGRSLGVRGFPTLFFSDSGSQNLMLYGVKPYQDFEKALLQLLPSARKKPLDVSSDLSLFTHYPTLTVKEYSVLYGITTDAARKRLEKQVSEGRLNKQTVKTGAMYRVIK